MKNPNKKISYLLTISLLAVFLLIQPGCTSAPEPPPEPVPAPEPEPLYDQIIVVKSIGDYTLLTVPDSADYVIKYIDTDDLTIKVIRVFEFGDSLPARDQLTEFENNMGVASRTKSRTYTIATFGEFTGTKGSGKLVLLIEVPLGMFVEKKSKLHGPKSKTMLVDTESEPEYQPPFRLREDKGWKALKSTSLKGKQWDF